MIKQLKNFCKKSFKFAFTFFIVFSIQNVFAKEELVETSKNEIEAKLNDIESSNLDSKQKIKKDLVDKVIAKVNGACILKSDLEKPKISKNGEFLTLQEAVSEELLCQKAVDRKLLPTESEIDRQISTLKIHNGLGDVPEDVFEEQLKEEGFSLKEYKDQLARMLAVEKLKQAEFSERVVVTSQEVEEYNKNNPMRLQEKYLLKMAEVDKDLIDENGKLTQSVDLRWDDLGWIEKTDLSSQLNLVTNMNVGQVSEPVKIGNNYQIIKLEDKKGERVLSLDERYFEIERTLHEQKKMKFEKEFELDLRKKASIVYLS